MIGGSEVRKKDSTKHKIRGKNFSWKVSQVPVLLCSTGSWCWRLEQIFQCEERMHSAVKWVWCLYGSVTLHRHRTGIGTGTGTKWKVMYAVEMFTLVRDRDRDQNLLFPIVPVSFPALVTGPLQCDHTITRVSHICGISGFRH